MQTAFTNDIFDVISFWCSSLHLPMHTVIMTSVKPAETYIFKLFEYI
ncbi:hypothetical protein BTN49_0167 [Candidatus Enterovibrio escicola]|uniref:Uncharacterized protein n=1 Tax=Candidatus Enterovibrio escicola TaxID=1927127 RepID=A0A2A5T7L8_9GAMM|nr:hypothetical protein BTN49_0167 [Candidatus Enterovibrio escacola]